MKTIIQIQTVDSRSVARSVLVNHAGQTSWPVHVDADGKPAAQQVGKSAVRGGRRGGGAGFTIVEMMVSMAVLAIMILMISSVFSQAHRGWTVAENRTQTYQRGRFILNHISADLQRVVAFSNSTKQVRFYGTPNAIHMVAATVNPATGRSLDLEEVGYEFDSSVRKLTRNSTKPVGPQPSLVGGANPSYLWAQLPGGSTPACQSGGEDQRGYFFKVYKPVEITHVGYFDCQSDGLGTTVDRTIRLWSTAGTLLRIQTIGPSTGGKYYENWYIMKAWAPLLLAPGDYALIAQRSPDWIGPVASFQEKDAYNEMAVQPTAAACRVGSSGGYPSWCGAIASWGNSVTMRWRLPSSGASGGGGEPLTENADDGSGGMESSGTWNIYDANWYATYDTNEVATIASNSVISISYKYINAAGATSDTWPASSVLPKYVKISTMVINDRAADALAKSGAFESITNTWGRVFSTTVPLGR